MGNGSLDEGRVRRYSHGHKIGVGILGIAAYSGFLIWVGGITGSNEKARQIKDNPPVIIEDFNKDGTLDYIINNDSTQIAFISKGQTFVKATLREQDGFPFYVTKEGFYDFDGKFHSHNPWYFFIPDTSKK